jgi:hypothetical protein
MVECPGKKLVMCTVTPGNAVTRAEGGHGRGGKRLLSNTDVYWPVDAFVFFQFNDTPLERVDEEHLKENAAANVDA